MSFDPIIHAPLRLRLCSILAAVDEVEFSVIREQLEVSDSALSKHITTLSDSSYVKVRKGRVGDRRTTWISLTKTGNNALRGHLAALQQIIDSASTGS